MSAQKGFIGLAALIAIVLGLIVVGGGAYYLMHQNATPLTQQNLPELPTTPTGTPASVQQSTNNQVPTKSTTAQTSVPGMTEYTDADFGFSFWYPTQWQVTKVAVENPNEYPGGTVVKQLDVGPMTIQEFSSPTYSITDVNNNCPNLTCVTRKYFFSANGWMAYFPNGANGVAPGATVQVDVSSDTMGDLPMLQGAAQDESDTVVPLGGNDFLIVTGTITDNSSQDQNYLADTLVATNPSVATPASVAVQQASIQAEQQAYAGQ